MDWTCSKECRGPCVCGDLERRALATKAAMDFVPAPKLGRLAAYQAAKAGKSAEPVNPPTRVDPPEADSNVTPFLPRGGMK